MIVTGIGYIAELSVQLRKSPAELTSVLLVDLARLIFELNEYRPIPGVRRRWAIEDRHQRELRACKLDIIGHEIDKRMPRPHRTCPACDGAKGKWVFHSMEKGEVFKKCPLCLGSGVVSQTKIRGYDFDCEQCSLREGAFFERGFARCNNCGYPSQ